jgi:hypothetical protein
LAGGKWGAGSGLLFQLLDSPSGTRVGAWLMLVLPGNIVSVNAMTRAMLVSFPASE